MPLWNLDTSFQKTSGKRFLLPLGDVDSQHLSMIVQQGGVDNGRRCLLALNAKLRTLQGGELHRQELRQFNKLLSWGLATGFVQR